MQQTSGNHKRSGNHSCSHCLPCKAVHLFMLVHSIPVHPGVMPLQSCRDMIKRAQDDFNGLDILVNNVGIQFVSPVHDFPEDKWDAIMDVCLNSAFHSTKAALPYMLEQKWGRIINTGSMHALVASPYKSAYNAAKHGIAGFTKTVGLEVAQKGNITCNCICPGYVLTDLIKNQLKDTAKARGIPEVSVTCVVTWDNTS